MGFRGKFGLLFKLNLTDLPLVLQYAPEYSYVKAAASYGYTTFRYDRLGCGNSETPTNGFDVTQTATEVSILTNIARMLRETSNVGGQQWNRVVGIGHSLG